MEVIHLILGKANPQRMNGVNKVVNELATRQAIAALPVQVWGITKEVVHDYPERKYTTKLFAAQRNPFALDGALKKAISAKKGKAVFHIHGGFVPCFYTAALWMKKQGVPFVFTPHGSYNTIAMQRSAWSKKMYLQLFEKKLLKAAARIHYLGQSEHGGLLAIYPNQKAVQIPYGFDLPVIEMPAVVSAAQNFIISFCGRIDIYTKGLDALLKGFQAFHHYYPLSQLWIIGDGPEKPALQKMAREFGIAEAVVFHGQKFGKDKISLLQKSHVFATTSRNEGLPAAILEAASLGLPCLVTEATNLGNSIRRYDAGVVIGDTDGGQVAEGLQQLYNRIVEGHEQALLHNNARQLIKKEYNWSRILNQYNELYYSVKNQHRKVAPLRAVA